MPDNADIDQRDLAGLGPSQSLTALTWLRVIPSSAKVHQRLRGHRPWSRFRDKTRAGIGNSGKRELRTSDLRTFLVIVEWCLNAVFFK